MTAMKLAREMLEDGSRPRRTVLDLPVNEEEEGEPPGEDDPEEDYYDEEDPIQEQGQGMPEKVNGVRKGSFNLKVGFLSKESNNWPFRERKK